MGDGLSFGLGKSFSWLFFSSVYFTFALICSFHSFLLFPLLHFYLSDSNNAIAIIHLIIASMILVCIRFGIALWIGICIWNWWLDEGVSKKKKKKINLILYLSVWFGFSVILGYGLWCHKNWFAFFSKLRTVVIERESYQKSHETVKMTRLSLKLVSIDSVYSVHRSELWNQIPFLLCLEFWL